jgi:5-deoxy-glucuronate isomerase
MSQRHIRRGTAAEGAYELVIAPEQAGWGFSGLRILELGAGGAHAFETGSDELIVLPLRGGCAINAGEAQFTLHGRDSVFSEVSDFVYVPRDTRVQLSTERGGRFALPSARADRRLEPRYVAAADVPVELRGAGQASRQVNNFRSPEGCAADRLIAVEVLTPAGNWSSYPPHKHDEEIPGVEAALEEIYYFEVADGGFGYQRCVTPRGRAARSTCSPRSGRATRS